MVQEWNSWNPVVQNPDILRNPDAYQALGASVSLIVISTVVIVTRFWARHRQSVGYRVDDWLILPAFAGNVVIGALGVWTHQNHTLGYATPRPPAGVDPLDFKSPVIQNGKKVIWALQFSQVFSLTFTKLSCLYFYRRIFYTGTKDAFHWVSMILIYASVAWGITFLIGFGVDCKGHVTAWWTDIRTLDEKCGIMLTLYMSYGISDFILDLAVFVLPFVMVSRLKMSRTRKIATASMFFLGAFAIAAGLVRMIILIQAIVTLIKAYTKTKTGANDGPVTAHLFWASVESLATFTAACLPSIYTPVRDMIKRWRTKISDAERIPSYAQDKWTKPTKSSKGRFWVFDTLSGIDDTMVTNQKDDMAMVPSKSGMATIETQIHSEPVLVVDSDKESEGRIVVVREIEQVESAANRI